MYNLNNFCCLCLQYNNNVTSQNSINSNAEEIMNYVIPANVLHNPEIPVQVCDNCLNSLNNFYKFRQSCLENSITFSEYVQKLIKEYGPYKYMSVPINAISRDVFIDNHNEDENFEQPTCEIRIKTEIMEDDEDDNSSTENGNENNLEILEQVIIKVEDSVNNLYENEDMNEELVTKEDSGVSHNDNFCTNDSIQEQNLRIDASSDVRDKNVESCDCEVEEKLPSNMEEETSKALSKILSQKSRMIYEKEYKCFQNWKNLKGTNSVSETVLITYFSEKSKKVKPSTLWSYYSMLKNTLLVNENCDISKYSGLISLLKKLSDGYKPQKSKTFEPNDVIRFLKVASDDDFLFMKVVAIMGLYGACRSDELYNLQICNVDDRKSVIVVSVIDTKTKKDRLFCITNNEFGLNLLEIVRKYISLRPKNVPHQKFFLNYRQKRCTVQAVGINTFYKVPRNIANFLKLPNPYMYTGHCFRRSAATMMAKSGTDLITTKTGWQLLPGVETYLEETVASKIAVSKNVLDGSVDEHTGASNQN